MLTPTRFRSHLIELFVVFFGVALAFAVENLREDLNDRSVGAQYLSGFRRDLVADREMLRVHQENLLTQLSDAQTVLEFFEGRANDPEVFFEAYWPTLFELRLTPNRNTMTEVLNSGSLRLVPDDDIRTGLLDLYTTYERIEGDEEHVARDFDVYLYDPTFSSVRFDLEGPAENTPENRRAVQTLVDDIRVENGIRLLIANLQLEGGLLELIASARSQVDVLLELIPED